MKSPKEIIIRKLIADGVFRDAYTEEQWDQVKMSGPSRFAFNNKPETWRAAEFLLPNGNTVGAEYQRELTTNYLSHYATANMFTRHPVMRVKRMLAGDCIGDLYHVSQHGDKVILNVNRDASDWVTGNLAIPYPNPAPILEELILKLEKYTPLRFSPEGYIVANSGEMWHVGNLANIEQGVSNIKLSFGDDRRGITMDGTDKDLRHLYIWLDTYRSFITGVF